MLTEARYFLSQYPGGYSKKQKVIVNICSKYSKKVIVNNLSELSKSNESDIKMQEISEYCHHSGTIKSTAMIAEVGQKTSGRLSSAMALLPD